jgi:hypothetical protein
VILGVVGRAVPPEKRSMGMGIASAAGSFGQFAMVPGTLGLIGWLGWSAALLVLGCWWPDRAAGEHAQGQAAAGAWP